MKPTGYAAAARCNNLAIPMPTQFQSYVNWMMSKTQTIGKPRCPSGPPFHGGDNGYLRVQCQHNFRARKIKSWKNKIQNKAKIQKQFTMAEKQPPHVQNTNNRQTNMPIRTAFPRRRWLVPHIPVPTQFQSSKNEMVKDNNPKQSDKSLTVVWVGVDWM